MTPGLAAVTGLGRRLRRPHPPLNPIMTGDRDETAAGPYRRVL